MLHHMTKKVAQTLNLLSRFVFLSIAILISQAWATPNVLASNSLASYLLIINQSESSLTQTHNYLLDIAKDMPDLDMTAKNAFDNLTPQIISLKINENTIDASYLIYTDAYNTTICLKQQDLQKYFSKEAAFYRYIKDKDSYLCLKKSNNLTRFNLDHELGVLSINVSPSWLVKNTINLGSSTDTIIPNNPIFANTTLYQLYLSDYTSQGVSNLSTSLSFLNQLSTLKGSLINSGSYTLNQNFTRSQSYWQTDFPNSMTSLILGDTNNYAGSWGGSIFYGGIHYGTNINLRPNSIFSALPMIQGQAAVPTTAQILINGQQLTNLNLNPGPFEVYNIPILNSNGTITMLLRDATGRVYQQINVPFFASTSILKKGSYMYWYDAGLPNNNPGGLNLGYQPNQSFFSTDQLYGVTNSYTVDLHSELQPGILYNLGITNNIQILNQLSTGFSTAISQSILGVGGLFQISLTRNSNPIHKVGFGYAITATTPQFQRLGIVTPNGLDYATSQTAFINLPVSQASSLSLGAILQDERGIGNLNSYNTTYTWQIVKSLNFNLMAMYNTIPNSTPAVSIFANLSYLLKNNASLQTSYQNQLQNDQLTHNIASVYQYNSPTNLYGYNIATTINPSTLTSSSNDNSTSSNSISTGGFYNTNHFNINGQLFLQNTQNYSLNGTLQGSVAIHKEGLNFGRYTNLSYAVVKVESLANIGVLLNGTLVGKTDSKGIFVIPNIPSYLKQTISIVATDLPFNMNLEEYSKEIVAPFNAGIEVEFSPVEEIPAIATLKIESNQYPQAGLSSQLFEEGKSEIIEEPTVTTNGLVQLLKYSKKKKYYIKLATPLGNYICRLKEKQTQPSPKYMIFMEDSICEKQY